MLSVLDNHDIFILALSLEAKTSQEETSQNYNTLEVGRMDAKNPGLQKAFGVSSPWIFRQVTIYKVSSLKCSHLLLVQKLKKYGQSVE